MVPLLFKMSKIAEYRDRLRQVDFEEETLRLARENDTRYIDLNQEQLFRGVDSNDRLLKPPYASKYYAKLKLSKNPAGVVDLKLTGAFYNEFFLSAASFPIFLGSADEKTFMLVNKYGKEIFGLDKKNRGVVAKNVIRPGLTKYFRAITNL